jgi:FtsP/CotA-like multicopper oxidase with cupredoxin domain
VVSARASNLKAALILKSILAVVFFCWMAPAALAQDGGRCPRFAAGDEVQPPPELTSHNGVLKADFRYYTALDSHNRTLFCFATPDGIESPTLRVNPGDTIILKVTNYLPPSAGMMTMNIRCGDRTMTATSVNVHFHGTNTSPLCGSDESIRTLINSGQTFTYVVHIPKDEPPGLYWYHPHVHGISSPAVQGGASGLIVVNGIENIQPAVAGLPERLLIVRDQPLANPGRKKQPQPNWDLSLNYVPVPYPHYPPAIVKMQSGTQEFWRVANASANTILHLQVKIGEHAQPLQIVGFDGVPVGSQDGTQQGTIITQHDILLPPAGRAEFLVSAPPPGKTAVLMTEAIDGGPAGDSNPERPIASIETATTPADLKRMPERSGPPHKQRFEHLADAKVTARRHIYFSEIPGTSHRGADGLKFYITVKGQFLKVFDPNDPPAITTTQGAVEDWTIENHTSEVHEFHIHQIHFLLLEVNGKKVPKAQQQFYDTYQVPYWTGSGAFPNIKVRMDFRGPTVGDFVYHCHILDHEDGGMMAIIRVLPKT